MNEFANRDYELYNNINYTSEYNPGLINPKINNFFNDVLTKQEPVYPSVIKSEYTWNKFYKDYIEHNLLFIVILVGVAFFLVIRYYTMDMDPDKRDEFDQVFDDTDTDTDCDETDGKKIKKKLKKKYKSKLKKYKDEMDAEKGRILNIIGELSSLNYDDQSYNMYLRDNYEKQLAQLEAQRKQDSIEQQRQLNELRQFSDLIESQKNDVMTNQQQKILKKTQVKNTNKNTNTNTNKNPLDHTIKNWDESDESDDRSNFYNIKKYNKKNPDDYIDGLYIEAPYN